MNVLVTGGAGYIGSHATRVLLDAGHRVIVLDNLSHGFMGAVDARAEFVRADVAKSPRLLKQLRDRYGIDAVIHFAAFIEVAESMKDPGKYYRNNTGAGFALLEGMRASGVNKLVFSSTAAVYGNPERTPIDEDHPTQPINPYGRSKLMMEQAIADQVRAHGLGAIIFRYFNVAGAMPDASIGEAHDPESHLIPRLLQAAGDGDAKATICGTDYPTPDGTCIRDYVHVLDLAEAHRLAVEAVGPGDLRVYNLGSEHGFSVRDVIDVCRQVTGRPIPAEDAPRRPGDPPILVASSERARRELGWQPKRDDLRTIVEDAWRWHGPQPDGARSSGLALSERAPASVVSRKG